MADATNQTEQIINADTTPLDCSLSLDEVYAKGNPNREQSVINETRHDRIIDSNHPQNHPQHRQRTSLDESSIAPSIRHHPEANQIYQGHRRVRSGDAVAWGIHPINVNNQGYPAYTSHVPQPTMSHSMSMINIPTLPPSRYPNYNISSNYQSPLRTQMTHSMCVDNSANSLTHELLTKQTASFVKLQNAIAKATHYAEQLEQDINKGEIELNALLNVKTTSKDDCQCIRSENELLNKEINDMIQELDKLGIPLGGGSSGASASNPIEPANLQRMLRDYEDPSLVQPYFNINSPAVRSRTVFPSVTMQAPPVTMQPPSYNSVFDPVPGYESIKHSPNVPLTNETPPPLPPRPMRQTSTSSPQPNSNPIREEPNVAEQLTEHWTCPKCTFQNLLVPECEFCYTPRPITLNRPH